MQPKGLDQYDEEAKQRWGNTDAYKQSAERVKNMTKEDFALIQEASDALLAEITAEMDKGADSPEVQELIERHYDALRTFYEPNLELYRGLAEMYIADPRFTKYYEDRGIGLAQFMHNAMIAYCDNKEAN